MRSYVILFLATMTIGCNEQLKVTTENLVGSWAYLDHAYHYTEIHFNDSIYAIHEELVGLSGRYYWLRNDTMLGANGSNPPIPIAIIRELTSQKLVLEQPDQDYELERINDISRQAFSQLASDSAHILDLPDFVERANNFYKQKGMERETIILDDNEFEDILKEF